MTAAIRIEGVRARLAPNGGNGEAAGPELEVQAAVCRLSEAALAAFARALPSGFPLRIERLRLGEDGRAQIEAEIRGLRLSLEVRPEASPEGRLRLRLLRLRPFGLIPLPPGAVLGALRGRLPRRPGLHPGADDYIEIDPAEIAAAAAESGSAPGRPALRLRLPPLRAARIETGRLDLVWGAPEAPSQPDSGGSPCPAPG